MKSLYYCRSRSIQRAESSAASLVDGTAIPMIGKVNSEDRPKGPGDEGGNDYEECLSCQ